MDGELILSIDAMGGDTAPQTVIDGLARYCETSSEARFALHGDETRIKPLLASHPSVAKRCEIRHTDIAVGMDEKPSQALRNARGSSLWNMVDMVKQGEARAALSAGNTGALMAMSMLQLRKMKGVHRPGMTALFPTKRGPTVILDVGANLDADAEQLVTFAIMGDAYARALLGKDRPKIGLLNIGSEETKGHDELREAAATLSDPSIDVNYHGFIEGDDIAQGVVDVVVTDGFTGNVAIKTAEGMGRVFAGYLREALTEGPLAKAAAALAAKSLKGMRSKLNPSNANGAVLLGLNGIVMKAHGGSDGEGIAVVLGRAADLARSHYMEEVANGLARYQALRGGSAEAAE